MLTISNLENKETFNSVSLPEKFSFLLQSYCDKANQLGFPLQAHVGNSFAKYRSLPVEKQQAIYDNFSVYYDICASALEHDIDLNDDNFSLVWWASKKLNLRPTSDMFSLLEKGDVVEIYSLDFRQIFRTFNMFRYLSYSLDEILSYEFWELFNRDESITHQTIEIAKKYMSGELRSVFKTSFQDHVVEEVFSQSKNKARMHHKFFSPFFDGNGNLAAIGSVFSILEFGQISQ